MSNSWLDINILEAYISGTLDPKTMHLVEKEALEDPFIAEAIEGLSQSTAYSSQISLLQKQLYDRISQQKETKKASVITWQRLSIAAAASVVFISVAIMFVMREQNSKATQTAKSKSRGVEVQLSPDPADSLPEAAVIEDMPTAGKSSPLASVLIDTAVNDRPINTDGNIYTVDEAVSKAITDIKEEGLAKNSVRSDQSINEVVAKSYGVQQKKELQEANVSLETKALTVIPEAELTPRLPLPIGGTVAYDNYLSANNKFLKRDSIGKAVLLTFIVLPDGSPAEIKVIAGIKRKYNKEAIRLITDGPRWILPQSGNNKVSLEVKF